ncbi:alpha/beta fold hydrolase [Allorhizobium pseudoryzae]
MWRDVAPAFQGTHQIVMFDLMGFGDSDTSYFSYERYQSLEDYADDFIEVVEETCSEPAVFVAHSVSAMIGVLAACKRPDFDEELLDERRYSSL